MIASRKMTPPRRRHHRRGGSLVLLAIVVAAVLATGAIWTNAFGAGERFDHLMDRIDFALHPPSDRATVPTVEVTEPPLFETETPGPQGSAVQPTEPGATPGPTPARKPVNVKIATNPDRMFISQYTNHWCNPAAVEIVLAIHGLARATVDFQQKLAGRLDDWETRSDAHAGGWGPASMAEALAAYGARGYEVRAYRSRTWALHDAAIAIERTQAPVILIAWRGAHAWVMTGFRADADPGLFRDAKISGTYIYDPWYPRISTIWGPSDPPGAFQDWPEMQRNYLPWDRPEGAYPERDGKFLALVPTIPLADQKGPD